MRNSQHLAGLDSNERTRLGLACKGIDLTGELGKIAVDAIDAYRQNTGEDSDLVFDVGAAISDIVKNSGELLPEEQISAVRKAVDDVLHKWRQRK